MDWLGPGQEKVKSGDAASVHKLALIHITARELVTHLCKNI